MMKKHTKPMKWEAVPGNENPYQGATPDGIEAPRNILFFVHTDLQTLQAGARNSPRHHRFVLIVNRRSEGKVAVDGKWRRLREGEALLIFPYEVHAYGGFQSEDLTWVFVTFELNGWEEIAVWRDRISVVGTDWLDSLDAAGAEWIQKGKKSKRLPFLIGDLLLRGNFRPGKRPADKTVTGKWLTRVHALVLGPGPATWRIKELSLQLSISEPHLRARFRAEAGIGLGHYLRSVRLNRAAAMLAGLESSRIGEIARQCGYDTSYSFSRAFRAFVGETPRAYRSKWRQPQSGERPRRSPAGTFTV